MSRIFSLLVALVLGLQFYATDAEAALVDAPVAASDYITFGGADWAYASPCAPFAPSCGVIDLSYQGGLGWALPSIAQMDAAIAAAGGAAAWTAMFQNIGACAAEYFSSSYSHCDYSQATNGDIYNYSANVIDANAYYDEVFVVRVAAVPVPASLPLIVGGLGLMGFVARRRKRT
ncbi:PEP-CTERM sorting domain-containing protein [Arenibacterium sp. CAU 1754]